MGVFSFRLCPVMMRTWGFDVEGLIALTVGMSSRTPPGPVWTIETAISREHCFQ
jgi:hypothetical protein